VLSILREEGVKATFFLGPGPFLADPAEQPEPYHTCEILYDILADGHAIGDHSYTHLAYASCPRPSPKGEAQEGFTAADAWARACAVAGVGRYPTLTAAQVELQQNRTRDWFMDCIGSLPPFFRPPYGELTPPQVAYLNSLNYTVVTWSLESYDHEVRAARARRPRQHGTCAQGRATRTATFRRARRIAHRRARTRPRTRSATWTRGR